MENRYRGGNYRQDNRDTHANRNRQDEQFSPSSDDQFGESSWRSQSSDRWRTERNERGTAGYQGDNWQRDDGGYRSDTSSLDDYDRESARDRLTSGRSSTDDYRAGAYGAEQYRPRDASRYSSGYNYGSSYSGRSSSGGGSIPPRQFDRDDRGFFDRASDEVMSWFGDDDATRRRQMDHRADHRGKGPSGYTRSNERVLEDANERLMDDREVDASNITVTCVDNEITLNGTVASRHEKRRAEEIVDDVSGVKHVQNNLRVEKRDTYYSETSTLPAS